MKQVRNIIIRGNTFGRVIRENGKLDYIYFKSNYGFLISDLKEVLLKYENKLLDINKEFPLNLDKEDFKFIDKFCKKNNISEGYGNRNLIAKLIGEYKELS